MPDYDFSPCNNKRCKGNRNGVTYYVITSPMKYALSIGSTRPCPTCQKGIITRLASLPTLIMREADGLKTTGNSFTTKLHGQDTHIQFIDHKHTDPEYQSAMLEAARRNGMEGAYHNDKFGRTCVDVLSNIPDPLGAIERDKRTRGDRGRGETTRVNTPVKIRKPSRGKANTNLKPMIPIRKG